MGFSNIVSNVLLFTTIMALFVMMLVVYKGYVTTTNIALTKQTENSLNKMNSQIKIETNYTYSSQRLIVYVTNVGSVKLTQNYTDVYVNQSRINRSSVVYSLVNSKNVINKKHWDPKETAKFNIYVPLTSGTHYVMIANEYGNSAGLVITV